MQTMAQESMEALELSTRLKKLKNTTVSCHLEGQRRIVADGLNNIAKHKERWLRASAAGKTLLGALYRERELLAGSIRSVNNN